jgi:hypothetical protein
MLKSSTSSRFKTQPTYVGPNKLTLRHCAKEHYSQREDAGDSSLDKQSVKVDSRDWQK